MQRKYLLASLEQRECRARRLMYLSSKIILRVLYAAELREYRGIPPMDRVKAIRGGNGGERRIIRVCYRR